MKKIVKIVLVCIFLSNFLLSAEVVKFDSGIEVDLKENSVKMPVTVVNTKDSIEFIVSHGLAKDYESLFSTKAKGNELHFAMICAGIQQIKRADLKNKDAVLLNIFYDDGEKVRPLNQLLEWHSKKEFTNNDYFFQGSFFDHRENTRTYMANSSLNIVSPIFDLTAVIAPVYSAGNPYNLDTEDCLVPITTAMPLNSKGFLIFKKKK